MRIRYVSVHVAKALFNISHILHKVVELVRVKECINGIERILEDERGSALDHKGKDRLIGVRGAVVK